MSHAKPVPNQELTKFQRYRRNQSRRGLKLLRAWVPDPQSPGFAEEAARQAALLRRAPDEQEALAFIDATFDWPKE